MPAANLAIHTPTPGSVKPLNARQLAKAATRAKVLSSAKTLFEEVGYEAADMRTIAAWACVSTGAIFGHFSGKAELWEAIYGEPPISPEKARMLLAALRPFLSGALNHITRQDLLNARAAIALATTPSEGSGASVADGGSSLALPVKSDNHNHSEGGR